MLKNKDKVELTLRLSGAEFDEFSDLAHSRKMKHQAVLYEAWREWRSAHAHSPPRPIDEPKQTARTKHEAELIEAMLTTLRDHPKSEDGRLLSIILERIVRNSKEM